MGNRQKKVKIHQKTIKDQPTDKLLDAFITILAGGQGIVEANTLVRPEEGLQQAFGRTRCADQSAISRTLDACTQENVQQMRAACEEISRKIGQVHHSVDKHMPLLIDIDISGMQAGKSGEQVTKGYFSKDRNAYGRQLGRVYASQSHEIVYEQLYAGNVQLQHALQGLVEEMERVLRLNEQSHARMILRIDAGGGRDEDINWLLDCNYRLISKVMNYQRCVKLAQTVTHWLPDPNRVDREIGWVEVPHPYVRATRQLAIRWKNRSGGLHYQVLVFNLSDQELAQMTNGSLPATPEECLALAVHAYDLRGGGIETSFKNSKQALGLTKRNKRRFAAQEMLVLLAQLANNLIAWIQSLFAHLGAPPGPKLMIRNVFHISGKIHQNPDESIRITLNSGHPDAATFCQVFSKILAPNDLTLILRKI